MINCTSNKFRVLGLVKPLNAKILEKWSIFLHYVCNTSLMQKFYKIVFFCICVALWYNSRQMQLKITFGNLFLNFVPWDQNFTFILWKSKITRNEKFFFALFYVFTKTGIIYKYKFGPKQGIHIPFCVKLRKFGTSKITFFEKESFNSRQF